MRRGQATEGSVVSLFDGRPLSAEDLGLNRQEDYEPSPGITSLVTQLSLVLLDDRVRHRQAEARSLSDLFCCEEGIKDGCRCS
jgi:hypothetical protein